MSIFVLASWLCFGLTVVLMLTIIYWERFQLVKPSIMMLVFYVVQIQFPSTYMAARIETSIPNPWMYLTLAHLFPLAALLFGTFWLRGSAAVVFRRAVSTCSKRHNTNGTILLLSLLSAAVVVYYLSEVPWGNTGLYAILFEPDSAVQAREDSLKLLESALVRYSFAFFSSVLAPILAILLASKLWHPKRMRSPGTLVASLLGIGLLLVGVSLYGARGPSAFLLLAIFYALYLQKKFPFRPIRIIRITLIILTIPALLSLLHTRHQINAPDVTDSYVNMLDRVFGRNIDSHVWTVDFTQRYGFFGVGGIPKLAKLFGREPIDTFNVVGRAYRPNNPTISANSSFVFGYYACFGIIAFIPCLILTWLLDLVLLLYRKVRPSLIVPCLGASAVAASKFTFTYYTTALASGGFLLIVALSLLLSIKLQSTVFPRRALSPALGNVSR